MGANLRTYRLAKHASSGVACDAGGLFVGGTALLMRTDVLENDDRRWRPRPLADLNQALTRRYRAPIDVSAKLGGLAAVARALDDGDIARAQITALNLRLPDPPDVAAETDDDLIERVVALRDGGLLAKTFDTTKHPHWPGGSPNSVGGQFSPADAGAFGSSDPREPDQASDRRPPGSLSSAPSAREVTPVQAAVQAGQAMAATAARGLAAPARPRPTFGRQPDDSYRAPTGPSSEIYMRLNGQMPNDRIKTGECVDATEHFSGVTGPTKHRRPGRSIMDLTDADIGLAVASFGSDGRYNQDGLDQNSGIYMGRDSSGRPQIVDQWPSPPNPIAYNHSHLHALDTADPPYHPGIENNARSYHVIIASPQDH